MSSSLVRFALVASVLMLVSMAPPAGAAGPGYMTIVGAQQGPVEGDVTSTGREGTFEIYELHHLSNGGSQGAKHQPLIVTTRLSKGVPRLLAALDSGESLAVTIQFIGNDAQTGETINLYTFTLQNARLTVSEPIIADRLNPEMMGIPPRVRLRFEFDALIHTYDVDGETVIL